ncbi:hypothetical protein [Bdellovibrio sp. NC01]|uniref:hypothetical protein n=1 Tax=Bdellovibrio sp. NC01 TaxID=2220073 RepID=UPI001158B1D2|nr:hypothetical protein [Bdellovibrio sp. NC01]QDK36543.1 hypothetical protein DOE51_02480 [Bdellovibrio sp. NC01]
MLNALSKAITCACLLTLSSAAFAAGGLNLKDLKAGDVLVGKDTVSGQACELAITAVDGSKKSVALTLGSEVLQTIELKKVFSLKVNYVGAYAKKEGTDANGEWYTSNVEASLNQNVLNGDTRYQINRVIWWQNHYKPYDPHVDCAGLKLK